MPVRKIVGWVIVIFLAYYLVTQPTGAANAMHSLFNGLRSIGSSLATFFNHLNL
jgi:hypothetical protein